MKNPSEGGHEALRGSIKVSSPAELQLALDNIRLVQGQLEKNTENEDPSVVELGGALLNSRRLKKLVGEVDGIIDILSNESEKLIESPNANDPEVLARRKEIADEINKLLEITTDISNHNDDLLSLDSFIAAKSPEEIAKAEDYLNRCDEVVRRILNPETKYN